jgi:hypothetical protein
MKQKLKKRKGMKSFFIREFQELNLSSKLSKRKKFMPGHVINDLDFMEEEITFGIGSSRREL